MTADKETADRQRDSSRQQTADKETAADSRQQTKRHQTTAA